MAAYREEWGQCMACGHTFERYAKELHHITGRSRTAWVKDCEPHDRRNFLVLCSACHAAVGSTPARIDGVDYPPLSRDNQFWIKSRLDPDDFDPEYLARRIGRDINLEPPDAFYAVHSDE